MMYVTPTSRGFTLLIAVIVSSVVLSVGLALLDVSYKQALLASSAKQSQAAFDAADAAMECALYWDQQYDAFDYTGQPQSSISCQGQAIPLTWDAGGTLHVSSFSIPCPGGGVNASVSIYKDSLNATSLYATGYNTCSASDPRRSERGLKASY